MFCWTTIVFYIDKFFQKRFSSYLKREFKIQNLIAFLTDLADFMMPKLLNLKVSFDSW